MIQDSSIPDVFLPHEWYHHDIQFGLMKAGIKMPVFAKHLENALADYGYSAIPHNSDGICYIPGFWDDFTIAQYEKWGVPFEVMTKPQSIGAQEESIETKFKTMAPVSAVITPPLSCFNNTHHLGHKTVLHFDQPAMIVQKDFLPYNFQTCVHEAVNMAKDALKTRFDGKTFGILGARLNTLASGLRNIILYINFDDDSVDTGIKQVYLNVSDTMIPSGYNMIDHSNIRARFIPQPSFAFSSLCLKHINVNMASPSVQNLDFDDTFDKVQDIIEKQFSNKVNFRYIKFDMINNLIKVCVNDPMLEVQQNTVALKSCIEETLQCKVERLNYHAVAV